jgi:hypothetical protein
VGDGLVRVEVVDLDASGGRQINAISRATTSLTERSQEIKEAITQASDVAQEALAKMAPRGGWAVSHLEVTFGLTLAAEAGVILSKASADASFEVKLTIEKATGD